MPGFQSFFVPFCRGLENLYLDDLLFLFFNFEVPGQASISKYR